MSLIASLKFIVSHPINRSKKVRSIFRFVKWQINNVLNPYPIIYQFTNKAKLIVQKGMTGATGNLYCGLHEYEDMGFLLHLLRSDDLFVDIGANIGSYTVLASGHIGAGTFCFEPVPSTFKHLINNIYLNQMQARVQTFNMALGSHTGSINFTTSLDTINHVVKQPGADTIEVPIKTLDSVLQDSFAPTLIKMDVEGYETEVVNGALKTLSKTSLKAIIVELNGSGKRYGFEEDKIHAIFLDFGFKPFSYDPRKRFLSEALGNSGHNTIYIRDVEFVKKRITEAPTIEILNVRI